MNQKLSIKISIISFFLLIEVVIAHSVNIDYDPESSENLIWFIEYFISDKILKVVIPIFFFISAYLFFIKMELNQDFDLKVYKIKILKRLKTLGRPYIFWCFFWFMFLYIIQITPLFESFFGSPLYKLSIWKQFWNLFIEPINYPFWFIRELLFIVFLTPILFLLVKYFKYYILIIFFVASLFQLSVINLFDINIYRYHMLFYYCIGIYCAINNVNLKIKSIPIINISLILIYMFLCGFLIYIEFHYDLNLWYIKLLSNITTIIGCLAVWTNYDYLDNKYNFKYYDVYSYGFFIYAFHGIPILLLKDALVLYFKPTKLESLFFYFLSFTVIIICSIIIGKMLKKTIPRFYFFITGNR